MLVVSDSEAAGWLEALAGGPGDFDWDAGNASKNAKHGVTSADIESLLAGPIYFTGRILEPTHSEPRWLLLGRTVKGRRLALVFTRRGQRLRPISCRSMRREERKVYEETTGG